ncbi:hypothetical protein [Companilactobacillus insicii]|uniref:hypothetical protein n=1 Tax=Companilactobacillus insicii TaxID=1732567 RepID=UPI000F7B472E|nr:hypothetical protein [Companilactobacillus insicii]
MKRILVVCVFVIAICVVIALSGISILNTSDKRLNVNEMSISKLKDKTINIDDLKKIDVKIRSAKIIVKKSNSNSVSLKNISLNDYEISSHSGRLRISQKENEKHKLEIGKSTIIVINVKNDLNSIDINQLNGTLQFNNIVVNRMSINHSNGSTISDGLRLVDNGSIKKKNGKVELNNLIVDGLSVSVKNGSFKLNGKKEKNNYDDNKHNQLLIKNDNGQIMVNKK